jgi:hypothetical protein
VNPYGRFELDMNSHLGLAAAVTLPGPRGPSEAETARSAADGAARVGTLKTRLPASPAGGWGLARAWPLPVFAERFPGSLDWCPQTDAGLRFPRAISRYNCSGVARNANRVRLPSPACHATTPPHDFVGRSDSRLTAANS